MKTEIDKRIEAHTKVSIDAFDKGFELGKKEAQKLQDKKVKELKEEIKRNGNLHTDIGEENITRTDRHEKMLFEIIDNLSGFLEGDEE